MSATQPIRCPKCGRTDAVRKVSAIVAEGTRTSETAGIAVGFGDRSLDLMPIVGTSTSLSMLAAKLAPPNKPAKPLGYGLAAVFMIGRLTLVLFVGLLIAGTTLASFPLLMNSYSASRTLLLVLLATIALFILGAFLWIVRSAVQDVRAARNGQDTHKSRLLAWQSATEQWQSLYYCTRDDYVFTPNRAILVETTQIRNHSKSARK